MINVTIQPFGRSLMMMAIGSLKYQAMIKEKNIKAVEQSLKELEQQKKDVEMLDDMSFNMTSNIIDKRFSASRSFIETKGQQLYTGPIKKTATKEERILQQLSQKRMLKARTKYNNAVTSYNKTIIDKNLRSIYKFAT